MSNRYREHSIDASYQVSIPLTKRFQRRICLGNGSRRNGYNGHNLQLVEGGQYLAEVEQSLI